MFYGEEITIRSGLLITVLIAAILILPLDPKEKFNIKNRFWYALVFLASVFFAITNGGFKVTQELGIDADVVLLISYFLPALWFS